MIHIQIPRRWPQIVADPDPPGSNSLDPKQAWTLLRIFPQELLKKIPQKLKAPWMDGSFREKLVDLGNKTYPNMGNILEI